MIFIQKMAKNIRYQEKIDECRLIHYHLKLNTNLYEIKIIDSRFAYQITSMMEGVIQKVTKKLKKIIKKKDAWFIGFTPDIRYT